jgi:hypothetical protein
MSIMADKTDPTPEEVEQHGKILELLRTRNLGGGQQGVMEWRGNVRPSSEIPLSGDVFANAFGSGDFAIPTKEAYSRRALEEAIKDLARFFPHEYLAVSEVFDADVGGYGDLEYYERKAPAVAEAARRGAWLLVARLPPSEYRLVVEKHEPYTDDELEEMHRGNAGVYQMWRQAREEGLSRPEMVERITDTYGISERRLEQIIEQETPLEEQAEEGRIVSRKKNPLNSQNTSP